LTTCCRRAGQVKGAAIFNIHINPVEAKLAERPQGQKGITSNLVLSQKRADNVMQFMISRGVNPSLVSAQGFGEKDPVASNDTPEGRAKNRRVELTVAGSGN
jgi:flagellar motor protein MotB